MNTRKSVGKFVLFALMTLMLIVWAYINISRNSFLLVWGGVAIIGSVGIYKALVKGYRTKSMWLSIVASILYALIVAMGNTPLSGFSFLHGAIGKAAQGGFLALGGFVAFWGVLIIVENINLKYDERTESQDDVSDMPLRKNHFFDKLLSENEIVYFIVPFVSMVVINVLMLIFCRYPGIIDDDGMVVLKQIFGESPYTNHHSFFYTILVKAFLRAFSNPNTAIFIFCIFQIVFVAACMAYSVFSLKKLGFSKTVCAVAILIYSLYPMFIDYSFFVSKDIPFACFMLLAAVFIAKVVNGEEGKTSYYIALGFSLVGVGIFRSNGMFICLLMALVISVLWHKNKKLLVAIWGALVLSIILKRGVLAAVDVAQPDILEALAIPMQQITRVYITNPDSISQDDAALLGEIVDLNSIGECYNPQWVDFVKAAIRHKDNISYFEAHKIDYLKLYIRLDLKNPSAYVKAWIDETRGYWFTKQSFTITTPGIVSNSWGLHNQPLLPGADIIYTKAYDALLRNAFWKHLTCIAVFNWINILLIYKALVEKNKRAIALTIMCFAIFLSIFISVPLDAEYRYIYAAVVMMPFVGCISLQKNRNYSEEGRLESV